MKSALVIVLAMFTSSCVAVWPGTCSLDQVEIAGKLETVRRCKCDSLKFRILPATDGAPAPAGRILVQCDDTLIPFQVSAAAIHAGPSINDH